MERLTYWNEEYGCWSYHGPSGEAAKRLAAYEETGLEPEEINPTVKGHSEFLAYHEGYEQGEFDQYMEFCDGGISIDRLHDLAQADREGLCGIPPMKLHQKIFRVFDGEIREETVCGAIWEPLMPRPRWKVFVMGGGMPYFWHEVFGKTVFLSRAEAEAALRREQEAT